jgi:outer membrane receptor protein involved in Fe transport
LVDPVAGLSYTANAGDAAIDGVEISVSWAQRSGWELGTNITWLDARMAEDFDPGLGAVVRRGTQLPGASEWQVATMGSYRFNVKGAPRIVLSHRYLSEARGILDYDGAPTGDYSLIDVRAGITLGGITLTLFANNLADERGVTAATYYPQPTALEKHEYLVRPRTLGITLSWDLE